MIQTSEQYKSDIVGMSRTFQSRITMNNETVLDADLVKSFSITEKLNVNNNLTMGCSCSSEIKLNVFKSSTLIPYANSKLFVEIGLAISNNTVEWIPCGAYYVTDVKESSPVELALSAFDGMCLLEDAFDPNQVMWPASIYDIVEGISTATGISIDASFDWTPYEEYSIALDEVPETMTNRQMVGYIAGMMGKNAIFDRNGDLTFRWYGNTGVTITGDTQYLDGFTKLTESAVSVSSVSAGTKDNMYSAGSGFGITYENPYVTQDIVDAIYADIGTMSYMPSKIKWRGDPAMEAGDVFRAVWVDGTEYTVLLMSHILHFSGGLYSEITCYGQTERQAAISTSTTDKKITLAYESLQKAFQNATEKIAGNLGGYFAIEFDANGFPTGWRISDTPTVLPTSKIWRFNYGGLGFSSNGGASYESVALTNDGQINADMITAGVINADLIKAGVLESLDGSTWINMVDGTFSFAGQITFDGETFSINLMPELEGRFEELQEQIDDITDISPVPDSTYQDGIAGVQDGSDINILSQLKMGNWAYIVRTNGNLSMVWVGD